MKTQISRHEHLYFHHLVIETDYVQFQIFFFILKMFHVDHQRDVADDNPDYPPPYIPESSRGEAVDHEVHRAIQKRIDSVGGFANRFYLKDFSLHS